MELRQGEILGVVGRNGAGKSTLLKLLAGIIDQDRGEVVRKPHMTASLLALQVGFIPELTGRQNAILSCILLGLSRREAKRRIGNIFSYAEIEAAIDKPISSYSSGMRARLGFGVAMESDPEILLVDEVLGVGDAQFRRKSSELLHTRMTSGRSVVVVSHDINTLAQLCDRLMLVEDGCTTMEGSVDDVLNVYNAKMLEPSTGDMRVVADHVR